MTSTLIITPVQKLQENILSELFSYSGLQGTYICLDRTSNSLKSLFEKNNIDTSSFFFIDCVTRDTDEDVLYVSPDNLEKLSKAVSQAIALKGNLFLMIDAFSSLLIYNNEVKLDDFIGKLIEITKDIDLFAFTPDTKGEALLEDISKKFDIIQNKII